MIAQPDGPKTKLVIFKNPGLARRWEHPQLARILLSEHFLRDGIGSMPRSDRNWLLEAISTGRLLQAGDKHCSAGMRIAISTGKGYLVCGRDVEQRSRNEADHRALVVLTWLEGDRALCLQQRRDTIVVSL